jgi:hypothetical protein
MGFKEPFELTIFPRMPLVFQVIIIDTFRIAGALEDGGRLASRGEQSNIEW